MHWNALQKLIWSIILWSFFDYCSSTAAFSKIVSVLRCLLGDKSWLSWEPKLDRNQFSAVVEQFFYILETFPNLVTISAKHQISRYIWSSRKLCIWVKVPIGIPWIQLTKTGSFSKYSTEQLALEVTVPGSNWPRSLWSEIFLRIMRIWNTI